MPSAVKGIFMIVTVMLMCCSIYSYERDSTKKRSSIRRSRPRQMRVCLQLQFNYASAKSRSIFKYSRSGPFWNLLVVSLEFISQQTYVIKAYVKYIVNWGRSNSLTLLLVFCWKAIIFLSNVCTLKLQHWKKVTKNHWRGLLVIVFVLF